jgi:serine/threonine-protein kinase
MGGEMSEAALPEDELPDSRLDEVILHCDRFEAAWKAGSPVKIEQALAAASGEVRPALFRQLLALELELRRNRGDHLALEDYGDRFPDQADAIAAVFAALARTPARPRAPIESTESYRAAARNLLLGLLAFQNRFIDREALLGAFDAWVTDKSRSLGDILRQRGDFDSARQELIEALASEHLKQHGGDPEASLGALTSSIEPARQGLSKLADPDVQASVAAVGRGWADLGSTVLQAPPLRHAGERYRILRLHAEGGLGRVYEAHDVQLGRRVAVKEIQPSKAELDHLRSRFVLEAEISGGLQHPGIVPVYSLGHYADGKPFYAMRFVEGASLKEAIAKHHREHPKPDPTTVEFRTLLQRFIDICNAIAFAHSRRVLHRDLKPHNVMLGEYGEALIIDWGLAKVMGRREPSGGSGAPETLTPPSGSEAVPTLAGAALGTPNYMSPEQARGDLAALGPATDVYGLGAILYQLLTGRSPVPGKDEAEVREGVRRGAIASVRVLNPNVPRALEAVCLKSLALEPENRHSTALELREDVEHWLADEPVSAYREPFWVRVMRWVRKHRLAASTAASALFAGLAVGMAALGVVLARERAHTAEIIRADTETERWLTKAFDAFDGYREAAVVDPRVGQRRPQEELATSRAELLKMRDTLVDRASQFYEALVDEYQAARPTDLRARYRLARGLNGHGNILRMLGRGDEALRKFEAAADVSGQVTSAVGDLKTLIEHARSLSNLAVACAEGVDGERAVRNYREAIQWFEGLIDRRQDRPDALHEIAVARANLGNLLRGAQKMDEAKRELDLALPLFEEAAKLRPADGRLRRGLANAYNTLGVFYRDYQRLDLAETYDRRAVAIYEAILADGTPSEPDRAGYARATMNLAIVLDETNRFEPAHDFYLRSIPILDSLAAENPDLSTYAYISMLCHQNYGALLRSMNRPDDAVAQYQLAIEGMKKLLVRNREDRTLILYFAGTLGNLGNAHAVAGRFNQAEKARLEAIERLRPLENQAPKDPEILGALGRTWAELGADRVNSRHDADADPTLRTALQYLRRAIELAPGSVRSSWFFGNTAVALVDVLTRTARGDEAVRLSREVRDRGSSNPQMLYHAAIALALCSGTATTPAAKTSLAGEATGALRAALDRGFPDPLAAIADEAFKALRGHAEFDKIVDETRDRSFPRDPFAR